MNKLFYTFLFISLGTSTYAQQEHVVLASYAGQSEIKATKSITLTDGFYAPEGSNVWMRIVPMDLCRPVLRSASNNQNYILTRTFKVAGVNALNINDARNNCEENQEIQYLDGLGRPMQSISIQGSPSGKDLIQPIAYDAFGRESLKYRPYVATSDGGSFRTGAIDAQRDFFANPPSPSIAGSSPYSLTVFEPSPLNRVLEQGAFGTAWQPVTNSSAGHTLKTDYGTNIAGEVKLWSINASNNGADAGLYEPGKLYKTVIKDENWVSGTENTTEEFKDFEGRVVLKKTWKSSSESLSTYYVYDDFGNLRYVVPPAVTVNSFTESVSDSNFINFIYGYRYDGRRRLIEKKIPGKDDWDYMVYNKLDQVVLTQDPNQRASGQWLFSKYDAFGRTVATGLYTNSAGRPALETAVNAETVLWETRTGLDYNGASFPQSSFDNYTLSYYDDYDFAGNSFGQPNGTNQVTAGRTKGLLTGTKVKNLSTGALMLSVSYYDHEGRVVQSKSEHHLGGTDVIDNTYSFAGELTASTRTHTGNGVTTSIANRYVYDHMGRKLETFENINNQGEVKLSKLDYDELGQLQNKKLHNETQSTSFTYNERGWLTNSASSELSINLKYNIGNLPPFNGNISGQEYTNGSTNSFAYTYDPLNRLIQATAGNALGESISYDNMGNILSLTRDNHGTNSYTGYTGNKLTAISGFTNSNYGYDANGNMNSDSQKGITIGYNYLNLPQSISGSQSIAYTYDASGRKLRKVAPSGTIDYVSGIQYSNGAIDFIQTEEGVARNNSGSYSYEYNLSDHLGNVRTSFYQNPSTNQLEVLQRDDYYAFGLRKVAQGGNNKYLYNGKELQEELGQYDYGARFYDPVIGRWNAVDPKAELGRAWSPYNFGFDNPIYFVDPDGMWPEPGFLSNAWASAKSSFVNYYKSAVQTVKNIPSAVKAVSNMSAGEMAKTYAKTYVKALPINIVINNIKDVAQGVHGLATGNGKEFGDAVGRQVANTVTAVATEGVASGVGKAVSAAKDEITVFRVFGGDAKANGFSWTPENPSSVPNFRDAAGLPSGGASGATNTGEFIIKGTTNKSNIMDSYLANPLDGNKGGGVMEYIINPQNVKPIKISTAKPAL